jgi:glutamate--cysteine ligase
VGITAQTMRFLDVFLLHCLQTDSPLDTPQEIVALAHNQQSVAERGREPGLLLERGDSRVTLTDWGLELVRSFAPMAAQLDAAHGTTDYSASVQAAEHALHHPQTLPSARVLREMTEQFDGSFVAFVRAKSQSMKQSMLDAPWDNPRAQRFAQLAKTSLEDQRKIEAADTMPFDIYLREYLSPRRLVAQRQPSP